MEGGQGDVAAGLPGAGRVMLAVGLRNPGDRYVRTRHNAGAWIVSRLARERGLAFSPVGDLPAEAAGTADGLRLGLSGTYMNESGAAVAGLASYFRVEPSCLLVAHDELDLPPGTARYKFGGGSAGHNGLRDVAERLGTAGFWRLRIGIGHPRDLEGGLSNMPPERYVLEPPGEAHLGLIDECLGRVAEGWGDVESGAMDAAVRRLHGGD